MTRSFEDVLSCKANWSSQVVRLVYSWHLPGCRVAIVRFACSNVVKRNESFGQTRYIVACICCGSIQQAIGQVLYRNTILYWVLTSVRVREATKSHKQLWLKADLKISVQPVQAENTLAILSKRWHPPVVDSGSMWRGARVSGVDVSKLGSQLSTKSSQDDRTKKWREYFTCVNELSGGTSAVQAQDIVIYWHSGHLPLEQTLHQHGRVARWCP